MTVREKLVQYLKGNQLATDDWSSGELQEVTELFELYKEGKEGLKNDIKGLIPLYDEWIPYYQETHPILFEVETFDYKAMENPLFLYDLLKWTAVMTGSNPNEYSLLKTLLTSFRTAVFGNYVQTHRAIQAKFEKNGEIEKVLVEQASIFLAGNSPYFEDKGGRAEELIEELLSGKITDDGKKLFEEGYYFDYVPHLLLLPALSLMNRRVFFEKEEGRLAGDYKGMEKVLEQNIKLDKIMSGCMLGLRNDYPSYVMVIDRNGIVAEYENFKEHGDFKMAFEGLNALVLSDVLDDCAVSDIDKLRAKIELHKLKRDDNWVEPIAEENISSEEEFELVARYAKSLSAENVKSILLDCLKYLEFAIYLVEAMKYQEKVVRKLREVSQQFNLKLMQQFLAFVKYGGESFYKQMIDFLSSLADNTSELAQIIVRMDVCPNFIYFTGEEKARLFRRELELDGHEKAKIVKTIDTIKNAWISNKGVFDTEEVADDLLEIKTKIDNIAQDEDILLEGDMA